MWNEALVFNVPPNCSSNCLEHVSLEIAVANHELLGHSEYVGLIELPPPLNSL